MPGMYGGRLCAAHKELYWQPGIKKISFYPVLVYVKYTSFVFTGKIYF